MSIICKQTKGMMPYEGPCRLISPWINPGVLRRPR